MFTRNYFRPKQDDQAWEIIDEYPFATLSSNNADEEGVSLSMIPLLREGDYLLGHFARANPHWQPFREEKQVIALFQGPHAYISSTWYQVATAPTWNYITVAIRGILEIIEEKTFTNLVLDKLLQKFEASDGITISDFDSEKGEALKKGMVAFRIKIDAMEPIFKLSQNRDKTDYLNIIRHLEARKDENSLKLAKWMKRINPHS